MNTTTKILNRLYFARRQKAIARFADRAEELQARVLERLISRAKNTEWGRLHHFSEIRDYEDFARLVPVNTYEELKDFIQRMREGEHDVLWPGQVRWFAKSSGTTNDKSKFIPVSQEGLKGIHYQGGVPRK